MASLDSPLLLLADHRFGRLRMLRLLRAGANYVYWGMRSRARRPVSHQINCRASSR